MLAGCLFVITPRFYVADVLEKVRLRQPGRRSIDRVFKALARFEFGLV